MSVNIKRAYEKAAKSDGFRILVDRIWPRGISKEEAKIDLWLKEIAPSSELRKWFDHDEEKWLEFKKRYLKELKRNKEAVEHLKEKIKDGKVSLIYAAKDEKHNNAVVLFEEFG